MGQALADDALAPCDLGLLELDVDKGALIVVVVLNIKGFLLPRVLDIVRLYDREVLDEVLVEQCRVVDIAVLEVDSVVDDLVVLLN